MCVQCSLLTVCDLRACHYQQDSIGLVASFPGLLRFRFTKKECFSVLQVTKSWAGPGNEDTGLVEQSFLLIDT